MNSLSVQSYFGADKEAKVTTPSILEKPKRNTFKQDNLTNSETSQSKLTMQVKTPQYYHEFFQFVIIISMVLLAISTQLHHLILRWHIPLARQTRIEQTYNNFLILGQTRYQYNASLHNLPKSESSPYIYGDVTNHHKLITCQESNVSVISKKSQNSCAVSKGLIRGDSVSEKTNTAKRTGRWTREEHFRFLEALKLFGKEWKRVQQHVGTRSST